MYQYVTWKLKYHQEYFCNKIKNNSMSMAESFNSYSNAEQNTYFLVNLHNLSELQFRCQITLMLQKTFCPHKIFFSLFYCNKKPYTVHNISTGTIHYVYTNTIQDINNTLDIHKVKRKKIKYYTYQTIQQLCASPE